MRILNISTTKILSRIVLAFCGLFILLFAFLVFRWGLANSAASQADTIELAELAIGMSNNDPEAHYALARLLENSFEPQDYEKALAHYETAAALSPHKYFAWLELARAHESRGNSEKAMAALRRAENLAPNYSTVHWSIGNALIRRGDTANGVERLKIAARTNHVYSAPLVALFYQLNGGDLAPTRAMIGDSTQEKNTLVSLLRSEKRFDDAISVWNEIPPDERTTIFKDSGSALYTALAAEFHYRQALSVNNDLAGTTLFQAEKIHNNSFESAVKPQDGELFDWQISGGDSPTFALTDGRTKDGKFSLLIMFDAVDRGKSVRTISQAVAVQPGKRYVFESWHMAIVSTKADFRWVVTNAADGAILAKGEPILSRDTWTLSRIDFTAPADRDSIRISLQRDACTDAVCAVMGKMWIDALSLNLAD